MSSGMTAQGELFLRVLVEFWLEGNTVLRPGVLKEVRRGGWPAVVEVDIYRTRANIRVS